MKNYLRSLFSAVSFFCCLLVSQSSFAQVINNQSFDGVTFPPVGWLVPGGPPGGVLSRVTAGTSPAQTPHSGLGELQWNSNSTSSGTTGFLESPWISWSGRGASTPTVSFWFWRDVSAFNASPYLTEGVNISVASFSGQTALGFVPRAGAASASGTYLVSGSVLTTVTSGWFQYTFNIPPSYNTCNNVILFQFASNGGDNCFMDDVQYISYPSAGDVIPVMSLDSTCLHFGSVAVNGSRKDSLMISNTGCDTLKVSSIVATPGVFTVSPSSVNVLPGQQPTYIKVTFLPTAQTTYTGTVTFNSNDNVSSNTVCLTGTGVPPPIISVTPTALTATLSCCDSVTQSLTIHNTGGANLNSNITGGGVSNAKPKVLIITTASDAGTNAQNALVSTGQFNLSDINILVNPGTLTMSMLAPYNAVLVWTDNTFSTTMVGDTLKKFVDNGGGVIIGTYGFSTTWQMSGGIMAPNYSPFSPSASQCVSGTINLLTLPNPNHPIFKNISINPTYNTNCNYSNPFLNPGATLLATDMSGNNVVAENHSGKVVGMVIYPNNLNLANASTDMMFANALYYVYNKSTWLSANPTTTTTISGGTSNVNVKFKSCGLTAGTYTANVTISSNDPVNPIVNVPCTLTVQGSAQISFSKPCLNFGSLMVGATAQDSVLVTNTGCGNLNISSIVSSSGNYTVTPTSGSLLPGQAAYVKVTFAPPAIGGNPGTVTFYSNIANATVCLSGTGIAPLSLSVTLAGGNNQSLAICSVCDDGFAWGYNGYGQLGDGTTTDRHTSVPINLTNIVAVASGYYHSLGLKSNGTVWAWGNNGWGNLGDGTYNQRLNPVPVTGLTGVATAVAAGYYHSLALKGNGTVWAWGNNGNGQLGNGTTNQSPIPVQVSPLTGTVTAVAAGYYHSLALKSDGTVWAWGNNGNGQLGDGTTTQRLSPIQVTALTGTVIAIACGQFHSLAIKSDGSVWAWGNNGNGQLGDGTSGTNRLTPVQVTVLTGTVTAIAA